MSKLISKARSGVTLVELLVVVLIVTILSVSLLPLLKPFVVESQYAAEAIPAIGNMRTQIALHQYDKGVLPSISRDSSSNITNAIETWAFSTAAGEVSPAETDLFLAGYKTWGKDGPSDSDTVTAYDADDKKFGFGKRIDVDNQDLVGKRCKPVHFQYSVIANGSTYCYVLGCFGDNHGLPEGTGYAVCEICVTTSDGHVYKQIGTWKRYKATTNGQLTFGTIDGSPASTVDIKAVDFCPIPSPDGLDSESGGKLDMVEYLRAWGWEF